jgi:acyl carrier protein
VLTAVASVAGTDAALIADDTRLASLGLDSLDYTSVLLEVEEILGAELPLEALAEVAEADGLVVVGDVVRLLEAGESGV